ncbi:MAG TPA: hypothetical protein VLZ56_04170, partial [Mycoplana sp.]|nr:hypothetical protein [Mycoplana sp.]
MKLDHGTTAQKLDHVYALVASLDLDLAQAGLSSWAAESPRRASLAVLEHLANLRTDLDRLAAAAGADPNSSPYYLLRAMRPSATTRAAARAAIEATWPYP